ncbi:flavin-dependent oxidoreductase [Kitasatospora viridis]|uniref:2-polyprenyl-6-methoxyphenol hydroxylase-like FAD-dependent oxidoreductase n=1 Tax=Kitasatospora viridis TaxID=281105 RepID=A0A561UCK0_9ACTN|nr:flavin-dependent oxidoreductase [Kitasatospora viridis]TWF97077.1 2-polyprenyl-6-methoxyphenol hydroxylase-like FAD-dependent oxidoreductase [Kitasatospora viridis]
MRITIVGGGIAGLATALSLHAAGFEPEVWESARALNAVGVGINLLPHAVREFAELGLADELAGIGLAPERLLYCDRQGEPVWEEALGRHAGYRWPQYSVHRGLLQVLLLEAVRRRIGPDAVRTGMAFQRFEQTGDEVLVHFLDREHDTVTVERTELLIGADGIDSAVRAQLSPGEGPSNWNGVHMWRGVAEFPHVLGGRSLVVAGGEPGDKFVAYPIADPPEPGGNALMNWVLEVRHETAGLELDRSNRRIDIAEARAGFAKWSLPWIDLPALLESSSDIFEYPMLDRDPLPSWSSGRVTLLGDAAHPMFPMGMNGGSQSVVDARVLASCLAQDADPVAALRRYDRIRREPVNRIVLRNRELGPEKIIAEAAARGGELPAAQASEISQGYKQLAQATVEHLNSRSSLTVSRTVGQPAE